MPVYEVTFTECAEIEADDEDHAIKSLRENVHIYAEDDAYYKVEKIDSKNFDEYYTAEDYLLDEACKMLHKYLPQDFINMIDDDLHNSIVCAFEDYISKKEGI